MNKNVIYTIDLNEHNVFVDINVIEIELKKLFNIAFIGGDQYELQIAFSELLSDTDEELFYKILYSYIY